ncbi:DUF4350 domain-containing protein [Kitasatospora sp. NPDC050543]|uniref:DUF4350 domain-containing protein n=1 Tax=Kitasatospora sp. NPDC050543 TaxID=3364054 RepID=UPI0037975048
MTTTAPAPATAAQSASEAPDDTSLAPTPRRLWRRSRRYLLCAAFLLLVGLLIAGLKDSGRYPALDPRSPDPTGARAVVRLLEQQGVTVETTSTLTTPATGAGTLVLPSADLLTERQLRDLATARYGRLILIAPGPAALTALAPGVHPAEDTGGAAYVMPRSTPAACSLPEAVRAGTAHLGEMLYTPGPRAEGCYPRHGGYPLVRLTTGQGSDLVVLGGGTFLTNDVLDQDGNASLALGLLGSRPHLTWYLPDHAAGAPAARQKAITDFIPDGWYWATLQLAVAALLAAAWRARRLGPVVSENLPVVVRAAETTEGRARLYRRAGARARAADALRRAAVHRLAPALGVPLTSGTADPTALCAAVADRLPADQDHGAAAVQLLLYGPAPTDDTALLRLADDLDALERQVRQP